MYLINILVRVKCKLEIVFHEISSFSILENVYAGLIIFMPMLLPALVPERFFFLEIHKHISTYYSNLISIS